MAGSKLRLRAVWLLIIPFYVYASPSVILLSWGAGVSTVGLLLRAWAAGSIQKGRELATTGPYAHTRNPLYLGSFLLGAGVAVGGGLWVFGLAFVAFFLLVYGPTVRREVVELEALFGEQYRVYAANVPAILLRLTPYEGEPTDYRPPPPEPDGGPQGSTRGGFSSARYMRNREWEAALGAVVAFGFLSLKLKVGL